MGVGELPLGASPAVSERPSRVVPSTPQRFDSVKRFGSVQKCLGKSKHLIDFRKRFKAAADDFQERRRLHGQRFHERKFSGPRWIRKIRRRRTRSLIGCSSISTVS